jgi:hypothetical protein
VLKAIAGDVLRPAVVSAIIDSFLELARAVERVGC